MTSSTPPKGHSFVVYIDEAGDEGFKLGEGSSEWFVLSAVVIRSDLELETVKLVDDVRRLIKVADAHPLHFRNLKHERRLPFVERIAEAQLRTVTILAHKPSIRGSTLPVRPRLYFYCSRILFERLSWFCRDSVLAPGMAGCRAKIVFSHRSSTPYSELREYVRLLRDCAFRSS